MTMIRFDTFLTNVRAGRILTDNEFELLSYDKEGNVISIRYSGVYNSWQQIPGVVLYRSSPFHNKQNQ